MGGAHMQHFKELLTEKYGSDNEIKLLFLTSEFPLIANTDWLKDGLLAHGTEDNTPDVETFRLYLQEQKTIHEGKILGEYFDKLYDELFPNEEDFWLEYDLENMSQRAIDRLHYFYNEDINKQQQINIDMHKGKMMSFFNAIQELINYMDDK